MTDQPYRTQVARLTELNALVGQEVGLTEWTRISQEQIVRFGKLTGDEQWIHMDEEMARQHSPYGTTIAHGFMVLSLASKFCMEALGVEEVVMGVNYGLDKVRFINATPSGSYLRGRISLDSVEPVDKGAKYKLIVVFEIKGVDKPACVAEFIAVGYHP